jgi:hypothetical protein
MIEKVMEVLGDKESSEKQMDRPEEDMEEIQEKEEEEENVEEGKATLDVPNTDRKHRDMIAPTTFIEEESYSRSGDDYVEVLFVLDWPDEPDPMFLEEILYQTPINTDISIHVSPREKNKAIDELDRQLEKANAQAGSGVTATSQQARQRRLQNTQRVYDALTQGDANLHEISMYLTVRADDPEDLRLAVEQMVRKLRTNSIAPEILRNKQREGMQSVSPVGRDIVNYKNPALSGAVGAMYPFSTTTVRESGGVDVGVHAINNSPVTIKRFSRNNGYNQITAGKIGSGKTFGTLLEILRNKAAYGDDLVIYMLDPLNGFKPILELLGGKEVLVGGRVNINPMKITETPEEVFETIPDLDPYSEKKSQLMDFFEMYFELQGRELGDSRDILGLAIEETYAVNNITKDPETHANKSPTISDLIGVLRDMEANPADYAGVDDPDESELVNQIQEHASRLVLSLGEFDQGGQYENLAKESDLDLENEDIVYFNLSQQEGTGGLGLMMHLLLSEVYEQAKERPEKIMFCIDEAHYIMSDAKSLDFLEQAVRHSRHYDMGINFITQTLEEFFAHEQSEAIAQQCSMRRLHRIESGLTDDIMDTLNLNQSHVNFIQDAEPGSPETGYSEALYGVDEYGYVPIRIYPSDFELETISEAEERLDVNG